MAHRKVTVIGAGSVGSSIAYALTLKALVNEIVLLDINHDRAVGEAMDIYQGTPALSSSVDIYAGDYEAAAGSDIVIITSGLPRKPGQTRPDLTKANVGIFLDIAPQIARTCPNATYIIVSNPVDILTYVFQKITGIPENRVIGTGTLLDTARLRARISSCLDISQHNVHAFVFGGHGETSFIPWSIAEVSGVGIGEFQKNSVHDGEQPPALDLPAIEDYVRTSGEQVIACKKCTNYAIATTVCSVCEGLFGSANTVMTLSTMLHGEYGIDNVCLSLPVMIGSGELRGRVLPKLSRDELQKLQDSSTALKNVLTQIEL